MNGILDRVIETCQCFWFKPEPELKPELDSNDDLKESIGDFIRIAAEEFDTELCELQQHCEDRGQRIAATKLDDAIGEFRKVVRTIQAAEGEVV